MEKPRLRERRASRQTSFLIGETSCLPEAFPRGGNARFFEKRIALVSTVERVNGGKVPSVLKEKATDTTFLFILKSQYRLPLCPF